MGCVFCLQGEEQETKSANPGEVYLVRSPTNKTDGNVKIVKNIRLSEIKQDKENSRQGKISQNTSLHNLDLVTNNQPIKVEKSQNTNMLDIFAPEVIERKHITFKGEIEKKKETHNQDNFLKKEIVKDIPNQDGLFKKETIQETPNRNKYVENDHKHKEVKQEQVPNMTNVLLPSETLTIKISKNETMLPIWCDENKQITLNAKGKWSFNNTEVDSKGLPDRIMPNGFPLFSLLCRVGGDDRYFSVSDECTFIPKTSGPLFYFINSPNIDVKSEDSLELNIRNVSTISLEEIRRKMNIPSDVKSDNLLNSNFSEMEIEHFNLLNHLRSSPSNFADLYFHQHYLSNGAKQDHIYTLLKSMTPMRTFNVSNELKKTSDSLAEDLGKSGRFSHEDSNGETAEDKMKCDNVTKVEKNICLNKENVALEFVLKMLMDDMKIDKQNRNNLLNENLISIGISVRPHKKFKWVCVYNFTY